MRSALVITLTALLFGGAVQAQKVVEPPFSLPQRVVSMNLCTDQLAMMLAAPGQLVSVSYLARDDRSSAMARAATAYDINHGRAEEIYLLAPDLVIAGAYSTQATVDMLRRLDVPVAVMQPARALEDVTARILEMGALLGQDDRAEDMARTFERDLAMLRTAEPLDVRAALYTANGWTSGNSTLAGQILVAAGLRNVATEVGYVRGGIMPLEVLAMAAPDMVITSSGYPGTSRSEEILRHPVVEAFRAPGSNSAMRDRDWVCGTPHVLRAVQRLIEDRKTYQRGHE